MNCPRVSLKISPIVMHIRISAYRESSLRPNSVNSGCGQDDNEDTEDARRY